MEENEKKFTYTYSAGEQEEIKKIRQKYLRHVLHNGLGRYLVYTWHRYRNPGYGRNWVDISSVPENYEKAAGEAGA